jgi:ABC-2 type transport system ATP-binding protein
LEVKGPAGEIRARLAGVKGVFKVTDQGRTDPRLYVVECAPRQDIRDELASAVVSAGFSLLGLKATEMSLEEIFIQLTTKDKAEPDA